jgi:hypothetical protein
MNSGGPNLGLRISLGAIGLGQFLNGLFMLVSPDQWYAMVPGVTMTGPLNRHFIVDIGLMFVLSGALLAAGSWSGKTPATLALVGATWPALHAFFHVWGWIVHGLPRSVGILLSDSIGVMLISWLGLGFAYLNARAQRRNS